MARPRRRQRISIPLTAVLVLATACTGGQAAETSNGPGPSIAVPGDQDGRLPPPAPIVPVLRVPGGAAEVAAGTVVVLDGAVFASEPVARVELWAGSSLVHEYEPDGPETDVVVGLPWIPDRPGLHALALRAFDAEGGVATSFPLWVRAADVGLPLMANVKAAASVAGPWAAPSRPPRLGYAVAPADGAPQVTADSETCQATFDVAAVDGDGVAIYAATFGSGGFAPVLVLPASGGTASVDFGSAPVMVFTAAFDSAATRPGPPAVILPPNPCVEKGWDGDLVLGGGILGGLPGVDRAYLYLSSDGGETWDRAPATDQTFVYPNADGGFDFGPHLPKQASAVQFEAWGWKGNKLQPLGSGSWKAADPTVPSAGSGGLVLGATPGGGVLPGSELDWMEIAPSKAGTLCLFGPAPGQITLPESLCSNWKTGASYSNQFRWKMAGQPSHGLVQVSILPPPSGASVSFPGLVHTAKVPAPVGGVSTFDLALKQIFEPVQASVQDQPTGGYQMLNQLAIGGSESGGSPGFPLLTIAGFQNTFWVRVVPMGGVQPLPFASNPVQIHVERDKPPGQVGVGMPEIAVEMTRPRLPNSAYEHCVRVVSNPFGSKNPAPHEAGQWNTEHAELISKLLWYQADLDLYQNPSTQHFALQQASLYHGFENTAFLFENGNKKDGVGLVPGATVCAFKPSPPDKDIVDLIVDAVEFVAGAWDLVVTLWDQVKGFVIEFLAKYQCEPLAIAHGVPAAEAKKWCGVASEVAVNSALIYFGIPPTLPDFKQLVENGKEEFAAWIVQEAIKKTGIDCSVLQDKCQELAEDLIKSLLDEVQTQVTQSLTQKASSAGYVLMIHPGIEVVSEPAGIVSPAVFRVKFTRPAGQPPLPSCAVIGRVTGAKPNYAWQHFQLGFQQGAVSGEVMVSKSMPLDLSGLAEGESRTVTLVLPYLAPWFPPGQGPGTTQLVNHHKPQTHIFFLPDATLTMELLSNCLGTDPKPVASQLFGYDGPAEPWKIPS